MDFSEMNEALAEIGEPSKKVMVCATCQEPADKSCASCLQIHYCSAEHQKSHWKLHKKECSPMRIATSPLLGRHYIATRDLPRGTLVISETPFLINPSIGSGERSLCISCSTHFNEGHPCSKCQLSFCSPACSKNAIHSETECEALSKCSEANKSKLLAPPHLAYLRALHLKGNEPESWAKLMDLQGGDKYTSLEAVDDNDRWFVEEILPLLGGKGLEWIPEMLKLKGIFEINGVSRSLSTDGSHGICCLLYLRMSIFSNSCFPNVCKLIGPSPEFRVVGRTTVEVKKGEILAISYGEREIIAGAIKRQHTHQIGEFICHCERCVDGTGTELGSMLSAVKCTKESCKRGYLLPVDPLDMGMGALWKCNRSDQGCKGSKSWAKIDEGVSKLEDGIQNIVSGGALVETPKIKAFLSKLRKELHPNHWVVLKFQNLVTAMLDQYILRGSGLPEALIDLQIGMIEDLLRMAEFTAPGSSWTKASLMTFLFNAYNHRINSITWTRGTGTLRKRMIRKSLTLIEELLPIAKLYPHAWNDDRLGHFELQIESFEKALKMHF